MAAAATWRSPRRIADLRKGATLSALLIIVTGILLAVIFDEDTSLAASDPPIGMIIVLFAIQLIAVPAIALFGFLKHRQGLALGAFLPPAFIFLSSGVMVWVDAAEIRPALSHDFLPPNRQHEIVVLDLGISECGVTCLELLAQSNYAVAVPYGDSDVWRVFRKVEGDRCRTTEGVDAISFIRLGFAGVCMTEARQLRIDDALIIRSMVHKHGAPSEFLPRSFQGAYSDLIEREGGKERLLGRWIEGTIVSSSQFDWLVSIFEVGALEVAPSSKDNDFYSAALGIQFSESDPPGTADLAALLDALEPLLVEGKPGRPARELYETLVGRDYDRSRDVVVPRIKRLLQSGDPGKVETGVSIVKQLNSTERARFEADLGAPLGSKDPNSGAQ
jgi:hypothetical protein